MAVVDANFVKIELSLVDQTNSNNVASSGDASTEIRDGPLGISRAEKVNSTCVF